LSGRTLRGRRWIDAKKEPPGRLGVLARQAPLLSVRPLAAVSAHGVLMPILGPVVGDHHDRSDDGPWTWRGDGCV
jgi:hypothetical protein